MDDIAPDSGQPASPWPQHQIYYLTVEWLDTPHQPESPERLAQVVRHAIEHGHHHRADQPPARFVVRVKGNEVASEVSGTVEPHRRHA